MESTSGISMKKKTDKFKKDDIINDFEGIQLKTFKVSDMREYRIVDFIYKESFFKYLKRVNDSNDYFTYYRGTNMNRVGGGSVDYIAKNDLGKFFIVGEKGKSYYGTESSSMEKEGASGNQIERLEVAIKEKFSCFNTDLLSDNLKKRAEELYAIIHNAGKVYFARLLYIKLQRKTTQRCILK